MEQIIMHLPLSITLISIFMGVCFLLQSTPVQSLKVQYDHGSSKDVSVSAECSRTCESQFCSIPPLLRYGKYCGVLYTGCPGEAPCDGLDACCQTHDACVTVNGDNYLDLGCNRELLQCITDFRQSDGETFDGNTCLVADVAGVIYSVIEAALVAGEIIHYP